MNLCNSNHDEICFERRNCPLCQLIDSHAEEITKLDDHHADLVAKLENQIGDLESERDDARAEAIELKSQIE